MGIGAATGVLMRLYRYDPILRATGRADLGRLLEVAFNRSVRLLERLSPLPEGPGLEDFIQAVYQLTDSAERVGGDLDYDIDGYHQALSVVVVLKNPTRFIPLETEDRALKGRVARVELLEYELGEPDASVTLIFTTFHTIII